MSVELPKGRVFETAGELVASAGTSGEVRHLEPGWVEKIRPRRPGRRPDPHVTQLVARIESAHYAEMELTLWAKCRHLAFEELYEEGRDPTEAEIVKLAKRHYAAVTRFYKKRGLIL